MKKPMFMHVLPNTHTQTHRESYNLQKVHTHRGINVYKYIRLILYNCVSLILKHCYCNVYNAMYLHK